MAKQKATFDRIRDIVVEQLGVEEDEVTMDANFTEDLGADSLDTVGLVGDIDHPRMAMISMRRADYETAKGCLPEPKVVRPTATTSEK